MSSTPVNDIEEEYLPHEFEVAYQEDLSYVIARLVAINHRINPRDSLVQQTVNTVYYINEELDNIVASAQAMLDTPARPRPHRPR